MRKRSERRAAMCRRAAALVAGAVLSVAGAVPAQAAADAASPAAAARAVTCQERGFLSSYQVRCRSWGALSYAARIQCTNLSTGGWRWDYSAWRTTSTYIWGSWTPGLSCWSGEYMSDAWYSTR